MTSVYRPFGAPQSGQAREPFRLADPLPPQSMPLPTPNSRNSVVVSGGRVSPYQSPAGNRPNNRPFEGTMRPEVPTNMSAYAPPTAPSRSAGMRWNGSQWTTPSTSRAQSRPPQSQGTPYNPGGAYDRDGRYSPNVPIPSQARGDITPEAVGRPMPRQGFVYESAPSYAPGGGLGNFANMQPGMRPDPFTAATYGPTGGQMDPSQAFDQRAAFVQSINDARTPFAEAAGNGYRGPPPQRDFGQMWSQAGDMVAGGWQNPLGLDAMMGRLAPQSPAARYSPFK